jgi:hypothetical protein
MPTAFELDERLASSQVVALTGATYRMLDYWATCGYVKPERQQRVAGTKLGSGVMRLWPMAEVSIVRRMVRLIGAGLSVEVAAGLARECTPGKPITIGDGIHLIIAPDLLFDLVADS